MNRQTVKPSSPQPIELLSPARNLECGIAAIEHGADAVYIGAARFGARAAAGNSTEDIHTLCLYAHRFGARVYVTLNTLLHDEEKEPARRLAWDLHRAGVDALIVQDNHFCSLPVGDEDAGFPPIALHASTQMDNRSAEKAAILNKQGFNQIVLARELTLEEIRAIHKAVPQVRIEAFVHGALCVSYSGRCYASEYCFGRSANRGECAQFCRLPFNLEDAHGNVLINDRYLLSLRDMNRLEHLEEMMDAGVRSFKIEGRLKDIGYVKNVTAAYRQAIDAILLRRPEYARSSYGTSTYTFQPDLSRSFSRGSTDYFLFGRTHDLAEPTTPKSKGREVGHVKEVRRDCIVVASTEAFCNGDGLCFYDKEGRLQGFRVNRAEGNHLYLSSAAQSPGINLRKGDRLWRSFDKHWEDLMSGKTAERRIKVRFLLEETEDGFCLNLSAEDGATCSKTFTSAHQEARSDQSQGIRDVLCKLGDTPYVCQDVEVRFSQPWFIPRSQLADWRRDVVSQSLLQASERATTAAESNRSAARDVPPNVVEEGDCLMTCRFCLRHAWGHCKKETANGKGSNNNQRPMLNGQWSMVNNQWSMNNGQWQDPLFLVLGDGRRFRLEFDCKNCLMRVLKK